MSRERILLSHYVSELAKLYLARTRSDQKKTYDHNSQEVQMTVWRDDSFILTISIEIVLFRYIRARGVIKLVHFDAKYKPLTIDWIGHYT